MNNNRPLRLVAASLIVLVLGVVTVVVINPEILEQPRPTVELREAPRAAPEQTETMQYTGGAELRDSYAGGVDVAAPAVVNIHTANRGGSQLHDFFREEPDGRRGSLGSGVIINPEGYILTNNHVIDGANAIRVTLKDGRETSAEIIGADPETDLAVLKVSMGELPSLRLGNSEALRVGDVVLAIGNPFGVGQTVTLGIVSATGRSRLGLNTFENFIQTDAAINPGNSGGALINPAGDLIGINTAIYSRTGGSQGIGFAIPASIIRDVMPQIIEEGHVTRGWLGVEIQPLTAELAESFGAPDTEGVLVAGILEDGPAARAGLEPGDIVQGIGERQVGNVESLLERVAKHKPGETIAVTILRKGEERIFEIEVGTRPAPDPQ